MYGRSESANHHRLIAARREAKLLQRHRKATLVRPYADIQVSLRGGPIARKEVGQQGLDGLHSRVKVWLETNAKRPARHIEDGDQIPIVTMDPEAMVVGKGIWINLLDKRGDEVDVEMVQGVSIFGGCCAPL